MVAASLNFFERCVGEWAPFLRLAPAVRGLLCRGPVARRFLIALRAMPLHVLGVVDGHAWADGEMRTAREFFFHDLDHARYKIREDLLALGYECPDVSAETPVILPLAEEAMLEAGQRLWELAPERLRLARELFERMDGLADRELALAVEWLLFEIVHEKSFPMDREILRREVGHERHVEKLRRKLESGFYQEASERVFARLPDARIWLEGVL